MEIGRAPDDSGALLIELKGSFFIGGKIYFDVLGIKITSCVWDGDLVIKGERSYDRPEITFFNAMYVDGLWDVEGKEILCVEKLEDEIYQIQYKDEKEVTILHAERYERLINN